MKGSLTLKQIALAGFLALSFFLFGGGSEVIAQDIPQMTVVIYNNSEDFNIYPLISFPGATPDKWLQAYFLVTQDQIDTQIYPSTSTTRMYVNCCEPGENGIPPGGSVTIMLPLYSPLVDGMPDPTLPGQLIEWWQGGNINLYESPITGGGLPAALETLWGDSTQEKVEITSGPPSCADQTTCHIHIFSATTGNPVPETPQQLVEFTLGAAPNRVNPQPGESVYVLNPKNVDYDVSYVNSAFMPAVMEPFGNDLQGYVGAPIKISEFGTAVTNFLGTANLGQMWPQYIGSDGAVVDGKVPSALEIFAKGVVNSPGSDNDGQWLSPPNFSPDPSTSDATPIQALISQWQTCQAGGTDDICTPINDVTALLNANFDNYVANYYTNQPDWNCDPAFKPHPSDRMHFTYLQLLQHLYGWQPFSEHCGAKANLLQDTPNYSLEDYQNVKNEFDKLQYWVDVLNGNYGIFHPYVALIHGPTFINAPYAYAYSVDAAVGNVQTDGTGLILAIGGPQNLPNPDHATPDVHFNFAYKSISNGHYFKKYGRCTPTPDTDTDPNFASFPVPVGVTQKVSDCLITFQDDLDRNYQFQISADYPPDGWPTDINESAPGRAPVEGSCINNTDPVIRKEWCDHIFVYQARLHDARNSVVYNVQIREPPPASP